MELPSPEQSDRKVMTRKCLNCGNEDTGEYCSKCGSKLNFLGEEYISPWQNLKAMLKEYSFEILDPIAAYVRTLFFLLGRPVSFYRVLYDRTETISSIRFPLARFWHTPFFRRIALSWRKLTRKRRTQSTLHPISFYASNFLINIISGALVFLFLLVLSLRSSEEFRVTPPLLTVSAPGISIFVYMLATAFIFDFLTRDSKMSPSFKYSFWVYTFSLVWIGPILGIFILIALLPITIACCCIFGLFIIFLQSYYPPNGAGAVSLYTIITNTYAVFSTTLNVLFASIGGVYIFAVTPWRVFRNIIPLEELPSSNLVVIIFASLLTPAIPLFMCSLPFLLSQFGSP
jgi:hypothetical protein